MKKAVIAIALGLAMPGAAQAQSGAQAGGGSIVTARALVATMHLERTLDTTFQQMMPLVADATLSAIGRAPDTPVALKARLETPDGRRQANATMAEELTTAFRRRYPQVQEAAAAEYAKSFSESELKALVAFYSSGAGAKMLAAQPQIQKMLSEAGRGIGREAATEAIPKAMARITAAPASATK